MKKIFRTLCVLLVTSLALTSCLKDDDETVTTYSDTAITQFTLGTLNVYTHTTSSSSGNDTIIKSTITGSSYKMTIDQVGRRIYNQTELPVGTDVEHVVCATITAKNSGLVAIKSLTSDSLQWYSSADSLDFSQPRIMRVYSVDGSSSRDYTVTLNVSSTEGITFGWTKMAEGLDVSAFADEQLLAFGDSVYSVTRGTVVKDGYAFRVNGSQVERSADLQQWDAVATADLKQLVAAGTKELFALGTDGRMKHSEDDGLTWQDETLDNDASLLPAENIAAVAWPYAPVDSTDYVLMAGNSQQDTETMVVWRKISQYGGVTKGGKWVYMPVDDANSYALPRQEGLSMVCLDDMVLALGDNLIFYETLDQGITWKTSTDYTLPETMTGTQVRMAIDGNGYLWVLTDSGELWQGRNQ